MKYNYKKYVKQVENCGDNSRNFFDMQQMENNTDSSNTLLIYGYNRKIGSKIIIFT